MLSTSSRLKAPPFAITVPIFLCSLFHSVLSIPALPMPTIANADYANPLTSSKGSLVNKGPVIDIQLPPELKKPSQIVQPSTGSPTAFASSFSGYSYDYDSPQTRRAWSFQASANPMPLNPYGSPSGAQPEGEESSRPREDAFLIRPAPAEQFILPAFPSPSSPSSKPSLKGIDEEMAKFLPPANSQKPKLSGWVIGIHEPPVRPGEPFPGGQAVSNPAAYYMQGADLGKVPPPRCELVGCQGPMPNDSDFQLEQNAGSAQNARTCHQTFMPLNGCLDMRGYPVGMICSICCECSAHLMNEMHKSRGWIQGFRAQP